MEEMGSLGGDRRRRRWEDRRRIVFRRRGWEIGGGECLGGGDG